MRKKYQRPMNCPKCGEVRPKMMPDGIPDIHCPKCNELVDNGPMSDRERDLMSFDNLTYQRLGGH